jgi:copper chaperone CopZ
MKRKSNKALLGTGILTAVAASLCCITPVLALLAGGSGIASAFSWMEPARPYLIGITVLVLGFAWYQKLKPVKAGEVECDCEEDEKPSFWKSRRFLGIVTVFAAIMLAFPYYSDVFYPDNNNGNFTINENLIQTVQFEIEGMTCESCDNHVAHAAQEVEGVFDAVADHKTGLASIRFDGSETTSEKIIESINATGYKVVGEYNQE